MDTPNAGARLLPPTLINVGWRYLLRHPWQSVLMIVGIMLGVAVVVAIDLANESAARAFALSTDAVVGKATHQVVGGPDGIDEAVYAELRKAGLDAELAPVISEYISSPQMGDRQIQVLGLDPFADAPFRNYLDSAVGVENRGLTDFLTVPGALILSVDLAAQYELSVGDVLELDIAGQQREAFVAALLQPADSLSERALDNLILADVATVQELSGRLGVIDQVDVILPDDDPAALTAFEAALPDGVRLQPVEARTGTVEQMTAAFSTNLTALSLLALIVGMFLIYNTMTFSIVQRRAMFGTLRCLGVTRREVFALVVSEALIVGVIGGLLGLVVGVLLGQGAVRLVTQTINDLFFVVSVRGIQLPVLSLLKGGLLGLLATVITAAVPAWEAASVPPRLALSRSGLESKARGAVRTTAIAGVVLGLAGAALLMIPSRSLVVSFSGTFAVLVGFALLAPVATVAFMQAVTPLTARAFGALGRMAPRDVVNSLSRTSIAVAALMVAVSVTIGVSLMISSFRFTVVTWLEQTLVGDVYISPPSTNTALASGDINPAVLDALAARDDIVSVAQLRNATVDSPLGTVDINAVDDGPPLDPRLYITAEGTPDELWAMMLDGAVLMSEPFMNRTGLPAEGGELTLYTPQGEVTVPVVGVYYSYGAPQGLIQMAMPVYQQLYGDTAVTALALDVAEGEDIRAVTQSVQAELARLQRLDVRDNLSLRSEALVVFDRTFAITGAMQVLATLVAFIGVLSALFSLQIEKQRQLGILRAVGMTAGQLWRLVMLQTGLMGVVSGLLAMPTGLALSAILIFIINKRSFGWTLQLNGDPWPFVQAMLVAIIAALLAGLYPARRMGKMITAEAIRFE